VASSAGDRKKDAGGLCGSLWPDTFFFLCSTSISKFGVAAIGVGEISLAASKDLADSQFVWCSITWPSGMLLVGFS